MSQQTVFPNAMFGFDKKAVLDYIYEQDVLSKQREEQAQTERETLEKELADQKNIVEELSNQQEILKAQLYNEKDAATGLKTSYDKLKADADQLLQQYRNKENELQIQLELNKQLQIRFSEQEARAAALEQQLNEKEEQEQSMAGKEQALADAAREAEEMLSKAKQEAQEMLQTASAKVQEHSADVLVQLRNDIAAFKAATMSSFRSFEASLGELAGHKNNAGETPTKCAQPKPVHTPSTKRKRDLRFFR